jgi:hypothetical protein
MRLKPGKSQCKEHSMISSDFWTTSLLAASAQPMFAAMAPSDIELLKARVRARLPADATGSITYSARANAVKGRVAK